MGLILCTVAGVVLPFLAGVYLMKGKTLLSLVCMNAGAFFVIAAIGKAASAT